MNFTDLSEKNRKQLHEEILSHAENLGGKNVFLQMIEDIRANGTNLLLEKSTAFRFNGGNISWTKSIYKDTLALLFEAVKADGDMFDGLKPKKQKSTLNMLKTLKPVIIRVKPKNMKDGEGFTLSIVETDIKDNATISLMFKIIFFYPIDFAKKALAYDE
jgi:hypothetical protein